MKLWREVRFYIDTRLILPPVTVLVTGFAKNPCFMRGTNTKLASGDGFGDGLAARHRRIPRRNAGENVVTKRFAGVSGDVVTGGQKRQLVSGVCILQNHSGDGFGDGPLGNPQKTSSPRHHPYG